MLEHHSEETKLKISLSHMGRLNPMFGKPGTMLGRHHSNAAKRKNAEKHRGELNYLFGKHLSKETRKKLRLSKLGNKNPMFGKCGKACPSFGKRRSKEARRRMREAALGRVYPRFNPTACQRIDEYGKKHGFNFQHALNGGEVRVIGYSLDGYDKDKNVVIEYYERAHKRLKNRKHDQQRKQEIVNHLGCKFIEIKEWEYVE